MNDTLRVYDHLSDRNGFNNALIHFQSVMGIIGDFEDGYNLADILNDLVNEKEIKQDQMPSIVSALLVDKYSYNFKSGNFINSLIDFEYIASSLEKLKSYDLLISYIHPELGYNVINPKNPDSWKNVSEFRKNEYFTVYAGKFTDDMTNSKEAEMLIQKVFDLFEGKKLKLPENLLKGKYKFKTLSEEPEKKAAPKKVAKNPVKKTSASQKAETSYQDEEHEEVAASGPVNTSKMTPLYSVPVTNELFHNGNVEAWKRIIQSFKVKNPDLEVYIFYDGERIQNIASLFKWGKVKHGSAILFAVAGENIQDVAKLQKYLKQGASPQFEAFLRFPVNTVLNLF